MKPTTPKHKTIIDWSTVDWAMRSVDISTTLRVDIAVVSRARRRWASDTLKPTRSPVSWINVDWSASNKEIARQLGARPNFVSKARSKHAPHTVRRYINRETGLPIR